MAVKSKHLAGLDVCEGHLSILPMERLSYHGLHFPNYPIEMGLT